MDKNSAEILKGIEAEISSLKERIGLLEERVAEYQRVTQQQEEEPRPETYTEEADFTDIEIGVADLPEDTETEPAPVFYPAPEPSPEPASEPVFEPEPIFEYEPEPEPEPAPAPSVPRPDTARMAWRLDKPGLPVKNIRSGISLYDRALFIATLFKEDFSLYDKTVGDLNSMGSLDEAVDYLTANFPEWNLKSDIVYNFIMAVRKKLG